MAKISSEFTGLAMLAYPGDVSDGMKIAGCDIGDTSSHLIETQLIIR
jgi:hypothetical protein